VTRLIGQNQPIVANRGLNLFTSFIFKVVDCKANNFVQSSCASLKAVHN